MTEQEQQSAHDRYQGRFNSIVKSLTWVGCCGMVCIAAVGVFASAHVALIVGQVVIVGTAVSTGLITLARQEQHREFSNQQRAGIGHKLDHVEQEVVQTKERAEQVKRKLDAAPLDAVPAHLRSIEHDVKGVRQSLQSARDLVPKEAKEAAEKLKEQCSSIAEQAAEAAVRKYVASKEHAGPG